MMQLIRDKAHGFVAWAIVAIISIAFCSWGVSGYLSDRSSTVLAKFNDHKIYKEEVEEQYNRWLRVASHQKDFDITKINIKQIQGQILHGLAEQRAILDGLKKARLYASDPQVLARIRHDPYLQENGQFSKDRYLNLLKQFNLSETDYFSMRREDLILQHIQQGIIASSFVLPDEAKRIYNIQNQKRSFAYVVVPLRLQTVQRASDAQIKEYYEGNPAEFIEPEQVKLEYLELSINDLNKQVKVDASKLSEYYEKNIALFTEPELYHFRHIYCGGADAQAKIESIYAKLKLGKDFASLAKKESEDTETASKGGDLGWITKTQDFPAEVFNLVRANDISSVIRSEYGWHIFQLVERKAPKAKDFATVKTLVESRYVRDEVERLFAKEAEELANLAFENPQSLDIAGKKLGLPLKFTEYFNRNSKAGLASSTAIVKAAFSDEVLNEGHNSEVIRISDDSVVVLRVADKKPEQKQTLEQVRDQIINKLQLQAKAEKAKLVADELLNAINAGVSPLKAAAAQKLQWQMVPNAGRQDKNLPTEILQQAFYLAKPLKVDKPTRQVFKISNGNYVVIELQSVIESKEIKDKTKAVQDEELTKIANQMAILIGQLEYRSLQEYLVAQAKIKYSEHTETKPE